MAKTRGAHSFKQQVRQGPTPLAAGPSAAAAGANPSLPAVRPPDVGDAKGYSSVALAQRRYYTQVGPTPPAPSHPRPARRAPPTKRARTSGPRESSTLRSRAPPFPPYQGIAGAPDLSPTSIIRQPYFPYDPIPGNVSCRERDFHGEVYYDLPAFSADPGLRESMLLIQRYHLEPFMVLRQHYYPWVVIEFYHMMTSRREANPTALHFSIDGRPGILRAFDITASLHLPVVLANAACYRQWLHPSTREMVRLLSMDAIGGSILFRRHLPQRMLMIDHVLRSNMFPLQYIVQRRGAISKVLYRISKGYWFSLAELIMTSLFHFVDRVHRRSLPRAESLPLLFPRLLCQVLEHIGFPVEPRLERRCGCEATLTIDRWRARPRAFHLPPPGSDEDEPTDDSPRGDLSPIVEHTGEPPAPVSPVSPPVSSTPRATAPVAPASVPQAPMPSTSPQTSGPIPTVRSDIAGSSTSTQPPQYITLSTRDFLALMETVRTFSATTASFAASQATLAERMTRTEASVAQIQANIMRLESHLGLPDVSP